MAELLHTELIALYMKEVKNVHSRTATEVLTVGLRYKAYISDCRGVRIAQVLRIGMTVGERIGYVLWRL